MPEGSPQSGRGTRRWSRKPSHLDQLYGSLTIKTSFITFSHMACFQSDQGHHTDFKYFVLTRLEAMLRMSSLAAMERLEGTIEQGKPRVCQQGTGSLGINQWMWIAHCWHRAKGLLQIMRLKWYILHVALSFDSILGEKKSQKACCWRCWKFY